MSDSPGKLSELLEQIVDETDGEQKVTFGDLLNALHTRSYGPLLLLPAIIAISPVGAIPGMSIVTGSIIFLMAAQMLAGRDHPWVPGRLLAFEFKHEKLKKGVDKTLPWVRKSEWVLSERLTILTKPPATRLIALLCMGLAVLFYPLALLPVAVGVPGTAITLFALGLTVRDGVLIVVGLGVSAAAVLMATALWPF